MHSKKDEEIFNEFYKAQFIESDESEIYHFSIPSSIIDKR